MLLICESSHLGNPECGPSFLWMTWSLVSTFLWDWLNQYIIVHPTYVIFCAQFLHHYVATLKPFWNLYQYVVLLPAKCWKIKLPHLKELSSKLWPSPSLGGSQQNHARFYGLAYKFMLSCRVHLLWDTDKCTECSHTKFLHSVMKLTAMGSPH